MSTLVAKISSTSALNGHFYLMDASGTNVIDEATNITTYSRQIKDGSSHILLIIVTGDNGAKYKINITGVKSAKHPTSEITLDGNRDDIPALIVG